MWLVQQELPNTRLRNFAVGGYGTLNCWLRFVEALDTFPVPKLVVVTYGAFHDKRNTWTRTWSRSIAPKRPEKAHELPYARLRGDGTFDIVHEVPSYHAFPLVHQLALSNWLEAKVGLFENRVLHRSHEVSEAILFAFQERCEQEGFLWSWRVFSTIL